MCEGNPRQPRIRRDGRPRHDPLFGSEELRGEGHHSTVSALQAAHVSSRRHSLGPTRPVLHQRSRPDLVVIPLLRGLLTFLIRPYG